MTIYEALKDSNLFLESFSQYPLSQANCPSKNNSNYIQTKQKLNVIKTIDNNTHTIIKNGRQVGITSLITNYIIHYVLTNTNKKIVIYNKVKTDYHNIIFQTLNHLNFVHSYNFNYTSKSNSLIEVNSNKIMISNDVNSLKGVGVDFVYLDDFAFCKNDIDVISNFIPIINFTKGKLIISSTPSSHNSLFNKIYTNSNHFAKVSLTNNNEDFQNRMKTMLDKEEYEMQVNAKIYPVVDFNSCKKK